jgi:ELWxxDGT repeat protein
MTSLLHVALQLACLLRAGAAPALAGTPRLIADINQPISAAGALPTDFTMVNVAYFASTDSVHGTELWHSDGTSEGTAQVRDLRPGVVGGNPTALTAVGSTLYFVVNNGRNG